MDLHSLVSDAIGLVNPMIPARLYKSNGSTTGLNGKRVPKYASSKSGDVQVQGIGGKELMHLNNMNISGVLRRVYLYGDWESVVRSTLRGGDKFVFSNGDIVDGTWLVEQVSETWPDWCSVVVKLQVNP